MKRKNNAFFFSSKHLKYFFCCFSSIIFLMLSLTSYYAHAVTWIVLQTNYEISDTISEEFSTNPFEKLSDYQCDFCGNLMQKAVQGPEGILSCHSCADTVTKFIQQKNSIINMSALDASSEIFFKLLNILPFSSYFHQHTLLEVIKNMILHHSSKMLTNYVFVDDKRIQKNIKKFRENTKNIYAICKDCNQSVQIDQLFNHATLHCFMCEFCNFFPTKTSLVERQQELEKHHQTCEETCTHCDKKIPSQQNKAHHTICTGQSITCSGCSEEISIQLYNDHVFQKLMDKNHQTVTCPCCSYGANCIHYLQHYEILHNVRQQKCPYCTKIFFKW